MLKSIQHNGGKIIYERVMVDCWRWEIFGRADTGWRQGRLPSGQEISFKMGASHGFGTSPTKRAALKRAKALLRPNA